MALTIHTFLLRKSLEAIEPLTKAAKKYLRIEPDGKGGERYVYADGKGGERYAAKKKRSTPSAQTSAQPESKARQQLTTLKNAPFTKDTQQRIDRYTDSLLKKLHHALADEQYIAEQQPLMAQGQGLTGDRTRFKMKKMNTPNHVATLQKFSDLRDLLSTTDSEFTFDRNLREYTMIALRINDHIDHIQDLLQRYPEDLRLHPSRYKEDRDAAETIAKDTMQNRTQAHARLLTSKRGALLPVLQTSLDL